MGDAMPESGQPLRVIEVWPHRALGRRGLSIFLGVMGGSIALLLGFIFLAPGVRLFGGGGRILVLATAPFFGAAFLGAWWAVRRNDLERARQRDRLSFYPGRIVVEQTDARGRTGRWEAPAQWARVSLRPGPRGELVALSASGRDVVVGAFLALDERAALADDIRRALDSARGSG